MLWQAVENFCGNPHDSKTLSVTLDSIHRMFGKEFSSVLVDRGYKGHGQVGSSEVILTGSCQGKSASARRQHKTRCRRRSAPRSDYRSSEIRAQTEPEFPSRQNRSWDECAFSSYRFQLKPSVSLDFSLRVEESRIYLFVFSVLLIVKTSRNMLQEICAW